MTRYLLRCGTTALCLALVATALGQAHEVSKLRAVAGQPKQEYFLIDHSGGKVPAAGYKLLVVLPGGDGSADFNPFVTRIGEHAAGQEYLLAQLVAVKWTPGQQIVWPTQDSRVENTEFTTEEFIGSVIGEIQKSRKIDPDHIYTLSWSSSGPGAYAASLRVPEIKGSFVAMSVFKPQQLPALDRAKGHRYYLYHSADDRVCPLRMAQDAQERLTSAGAEVKFVTYEGGHGWRGDVFGSMREGLSWLENR